MDASSGEQFFFPSLEKIKSYRVVVCTLTSSGRYVLGTG